MTYQDIIKMGKHDRLDPQEVDLDAAALSIPNLHQKWTALLFEEKLRFESLDRDYRSLRFRKWEYYSGKMTAEEVAAAGWKPFQYKPFKGDLEKYMEADNELADSRARVRIQEEKMNFIEQYLKELHSRSFNIRAAIDYRKFLTGG